MVTIIIIKAIILCIMCMLFPMQVYLVEVSLFPLTYIGYVVAVLGITVFRVSSSIRLQSLRRKKS